MLGISQLIDLGKGDLQLIQRLWPTLIDPRRLAGRSHETSGEEVGQPGMVLPEGDHADQQIRALEQRRPQRLWTAERQVVAAAGTAVPPVESKGLGAQPLLASDPVQRLDQVGELGPAGGWMDV